MRIPITFLISAFFCGRSIASEVYVVQKGDTLSTIIQKLYPGYGTREKRIYGPNGMLNRIMNLNQSINDPNLLIPGSLVVLYKFDQVITAEKQEKDESVPAKLEATPVMAGPLPVKRGPTQQSDPLQEIILPSSEEESLSIIAYAGLRHLTIKQTGALGVGAVGGFLTQKGLGTEFKLGDSIYSMALNSFDYRYRSLNQEDTLKIYSLDLRMVKDWFLLGLSLDQLPLFRNNGGQIEVLRESIYSLNLGYEKNTKLKTRKPTDLKFSTWFSLPLNANTDSDDAKITSVQGYGLNGRVRLTRTLFSKDTYDIKLYWSNDLQYLSLHQKTNWDVSKGNSTSTIFGASSSLGIVFNH